MTAQAQRLPWWRGIRPAYWCLAGAMLFYGSVGADLCRAPRRQVTARIYIALVQGYQFAARPVVKRFVTCRFEPSCSEYSVLAVRKYGMARGLMKTVGRLRRCTDETPLNTVDWP